MTPRARSGTHVSVTVDPAPETRDASEVGSSAARRAWAEAARPVLLEAAGRYRKTVTWKQLATAVQRDSGITTTLPMHQWIGDVLARVTDESQSRAEPLLSSLCVSRPGQRGRGVRRRRRARPRHPPGRPRRPRRARAARVLPTLGGHGAPPRRRHSPAHRPLQACAQGRGEPSLLRAATPRKTTARTPSARKTATAKPAPEEKPIRLCPTCFTQVPASGVCDYCD